MCRHTNPICNYSPCITRHPIFQTYAFSRPIITCVLAGTIPPSVIEMSSPAPVTFLFRIRNRTVKGETPHCAQCLSPIICMWFCIAERGEDADLRVETILVTVSGARCGEEARQNRKGLSNRNKLRRSTMFGYRTRFAEGCSHARKEGENKRPVLGIVSCVLCLVFSS